MKALWLDEEPNSLTYEQKLFTSRGWSVDLTSHVEDAKLYIMRETYDVVICDLILPRDSFDAETFFVDTNAGIEFIEHMRDVKRNGQTPPSVPIIVCTARLAAAAALTKFASPDAVLLLLMKPLLEDDLMRAASRVEEAARKALPPAKT